LLKQNLFNKYLDSTASAPYLLGKNGLNTFVSYDDSLSITTKANYIKNKNLQGCIIWEITGDYIETVVGSGVVASTPLVNALRNVFCSNPVSNVMELPKNAVLLFPNPTLDKVHIRLDDAPTGLIQIAVMDMNGAILFSKNIDNQLNTINEKVDIETFARGIYMVKIVTKAWNGTWLFSKIK
jgi:hypothetical protein